MWSASATTLSAVVLLAVSAAGEVRAQAHDKSATMREVMERAQQNERRGVEDLIEKLSRKTPSTKATPPVVAPAAELPKNATPAQLPVPAPTVAPAANSGAPAATAPSPVQPATAVATTAPPPATPMLETAPAPHSQAPVATVAAPPPVAAPSAPAPALANVATVNVATARPSAELEIYFEFASAVISARSTEQLRTLGKALTDPRLSEQKFLIAGYTDSKGKADYNMRLSQQRAEAVRDFLIEEFKVSPQRLIAKGYGKSRLKDQSNPTADANRRVQIVDWTN